MQIWDAINDGTIYSIPSLLSSFSIISFANLKKYTFSYWFAFPALHSDPIWTRVPDHTPEQLTGDSTTALVDEVGTWRLGCDPREHGFFLAKKVRLTKKEGEDERPDTPHESLGYKWVIGSLRDFESGFFRGVDEDDQYVSFVDPSTYPENPGWMLRNLLVLIRRRYKLSKVQILCYRDIHAKRHEARSKVILLQTDSDAKLSTEMPKVTGWERNSIGKLVPKVTNLAQYMDPRHLADQAVDLNLKLMKWRIAPTLNLERIKETKVLLLGAGTLGSFVARGLMAWGVRKITFVDNATVSFSNPVRQPLFDFKDCLTPPAKKAHRAAEVLAEIYPGVDATGHVMSVPMLGHPITDEENTKLDYQTLEKLIEEHDAVCLLMDTRESRWLPTVMGKAHGKIVLNAALGFDTYVVMRHGITPADGGEAALGCYFCNDVVAPQDVCTFHLLIDHANITSPSKTQRSTNNAPSPAPASPPSPPPSSSSSSPPSSNTPSAPAPPPLSPHPAVPLTNTSAIPLTIHSVSSPIRSVATSRRSKTW
jgi:ubiquitin-like modifier-activating enzyme ATG7